MDIINSTLRNDCKKCRLSYLLVALVMVLMTAQKAQAEAEADTYRYDVGVALGTTGYLGDVNRGNLMRRPGFSAQVMMHWLIDRRWALKGALGYGSISGNSEDCSDYFPKGVSYKFKANLIDLGAAMEFNFLNYGIGYHYKHLRRISPYLTVGVGATMSIVSGGPATFAANIPMGGGVKFKLNERMNLGIEFTMRKVIGGRIEHFNLGDLNGIYGKNNGWYSFLTVFFTFEYSKRCRACHYVD